LNVENEQRLLVSGSLLSQEIWKSPTDTPAFSLYKKELENFFTVMGAWKSWHIAITKLKPTQEVPSDFGSDFERGVGIKLRETPMSIANSLI
jgi:hypothetical protein